MSQSEGMVLLIRTAHAHMTNDYYINLLFSIPRRVPGVLDLETFEGEVGFIFQHPT